MHLRETQLARAVKQKKHQKIHVFSMENRGKLLRQTNFRPNQRKNQRERSNFVGAGEKIERERSNFIGTGEKIERERFDGTENGRFSFLQTSRFFPDPRNLGNFYG